MAFGKVRGGNIIIDYHVLSSFINDNIIHQFIIDDYVFT